MSRFDVTTLGEAMLRLSVPAGQPLETMTGLAVHLGGAESNVCAALAALGRRCAWVSRLPDNALGRYVLRTLRAAGVDTSAVGLAKDTRLGTYYVAFGAPPRATEVIYDRSGAAAADLTPETVAWEPLLDTRVLHLTGITPALSSGCFDLVLAAAQRAKAGGVRVSFDVNYRSKLWSPEAARRHLEPILPYVDLLFCGQEDVRTVFGLEGTVRDVLEALHTLTPAEQVVLTRSHEGATTLLGGELIDVPAREVAVVDRLGAGDAFAAGVLDGYLDDDIYTGLHKGVALNALVLAQHGDMLVTTPAELSAVLDGAASEGASPRLNR